MRLEGKSPEAALYEHYRIRPRTAELFIMPSFNDFLGGRPLNERRSVRGTRTDMIAGPVLRSSAVDMKRAETYLLDGTFLGTIDQLRILS
jgi:metallophosphoesterase superfamily enzyme